MTELLKDKIFHPFLFAAFPVLFLYAENVNMVAMQQVWAPLAIALLLTLVVYLFSWVLFRNWCKAGLFTSVFVLVFFLYNPLFSVIQTSSVTEFILPRHRQLIIILFFLLAGFAFCLFRSKNNFNALNLILNISAAILLLPSVLQITQKTLKPIAKLKLTNPVFTTTSHEEKPDIYYFIMDAYGRQDVLKETYHYDNQQFLNELSNRGFYISRKSTSNYFKTIHSIPSSLNFDYLQNLIDVKKSSNAGSVHAKELIQKSRLRRILTKHNFKYVSFSSGVNFTEISDADHYFSPGVGLSELDYALINLSPIPDLMQSFFPKDIYNIHRTTVLYPFTHIKDAIRIPGPKFVQIHILSPHPPFVFDQFGNAARVRNHPDIYRNDDVATEILPADYKAQYQEHQKAYVEQLKFLNKKLLQTLDTIFANSNKPPIVIIQSDHGARLNCHINNIDASNHFESFANLSAFYFPDQDTSNLYQEISPVNIFRVVLNKYFNSNLPLLPDKSYYSPENEPYKFTDVTQAVKTKQLGPVFPARP
ncbi:sulfatase-like hydrolase/transferase [Adhaeribacter sp. BT258]|uniref:Sulfatase-like hydrolase/transferase n=1 Tax=Adhaeribacter terrigena TaxID=2793070 RepID=A0ABS1C4Q9_9BACT|nr:sulfatase-like hydrolase/transferase [Adhaeribacter terrigena]MBK0404374.1 sulfatase-like hydrolase/transferase [Adhaeribacter terrigena]